MIALSKTFNELSELISFPGAYQNELETIKILHTLPAKKQRRFNELPLQLLDNLDQPHHRENCAQRSHSLREEGNRVFKSKTSASATDHSECVLSACRLYTQAIFEAENVYEELCLGFANRGMALQDYGYYAQAYDDCACALEFGYPAKMQHKLIMRQAHCAWKLGNAEKLREHVGQLEKLSLNANFAQQLEQLQQEMAQLQVNPTMKEQTETHIKITKAHKIVTDEGSRGRHMIAMERFKPGDLIFQERADCFLPVEQRLICQNCAASLMCAPIPCPQCHQRVVYCSRRCRQLHMQIHSYECAAYRRDLPRMLGISLLSLRMVITYLPLWLELVRGASNAQELWQTLMSQTTGTDNQTATQSMQSLCMITHLDKLPTDELLYHTLCAYLLQTYLHKCTKFYEELLSNTAVSTGDWHMILAALILRCTGQLLVNGHVSNTILPRSLASNEFALLQPALWQRPYHLKLGCLHKFDSFCLITAVNLPYLSLCNHACAPSILTKLDGCRAQNYATQDIDAGAEIFNCYTIDYKRSLSVQRRRQLQQTYKFKCRCSKCLHAQPDLEYFQFHRYRCESVQCAQIFVSQLLPKHSSLSWWLETEQDAKISCTTCKAPQQAAYLVHFLEQLEHCHQTQTRRELYKAFDSLNTWLLNYHSLKLYLATELITACFAVKEDGCHLNDTDYEQLARIIQFQLSGIAAQSGDTSIEYICRLTYLWDLIAWGKHKCTVKEMTIMRAAIEYLGNEARLIFVNYFNDFIEQHL